MQIFCNLEIERGLNKAKSKNYIDKFKSPILQDNSKNLSHKSSDLQGVKKNLNYTGTPEILSKQMTKLKSPDTNPLPTKISYNEMMQSNITSFREAVDM